MGDKEIELWSWSTPNGWKVEIALAELDLPFKYIPIDISKGVQFEDAFKKVSPNSKIPAIVDPSPINGGPPVSVFESGAILIYLAQKYGKLLPDARIDPHGNAEVIQWVMWQMAGFGPMLGQYNHFNNYAPEKIPYAIERYTKEANRLYKVLDNLLAGRPYVAGQEYSIAGIPVLIILLKWVPCVGLFFNVANEDESKEPLKLALDSLYERQKFDVPKDYPNVFRWFEVVKQRPAVAPLWQKLQERWEKEKLEGPKKHTPEELKILFGIEPKK